MFARLRQVFSAPDRKSLANPTEEELRLFTGGTLGGSFAVSATEALQVPSVQLAIRLISEGVAALDRRVVRIDGLQQIDAPDHPASRFLTSHWNDWTSPFEGVRDLVSSALTHDFGGVQWLNKPDGELREIVAYRSLTVQFDTDTGEPRYQLGTRPLPADEIVHIRGPFSRSPLSLARESIGVAHLMAERAGKLFKNAARPGGWIEFPEFLDEDAFIRMKKSWEEAHGSSENSGKTAILYAGGKFHAAEFKSTDAQFLELKKEQVVEIGRAFGVPPSMLFNHDRATWSNYETAARSYMVETLEAWIRVTEAALTRALIPAGERKTYRVVIDRDDLTRADLVARATAINSLRASEVLSADEARDWLGMAPRPADRLDDYKNPNINPDRAPAPAEAA
ncbi:phage portal protein [Hoeflea sp.]|uniref:phage portal protein n=1 Tax=Hoeflea sp. TaxID=1940281 RepID=UPI0025B7C11D|nr:phage portal protein [Hoeflea sp.]